MTSDKTMVEEMCDAIFAAILQTGPLPWETTDKANAACGYIAQAAATIAKGRMEAIDGILAEAERLVLDGHPSRALLRVEEAREALKDSPNVGT